MALDQFSSHNYSMKSSTRMWPRYRCEVLELMLKWMLCCSDETTLPLLDFNHNDLPWIGGCTVSTASAQIIQVSNNIFLCLFHPHPKSHYSWIVACRNNTTRRLTSPPLVIELLTVELWILISLRIKVTSVKPQEIQIMYSMPSM